MSPADRPSDALDTPAPAAAPRKTPGIDWLLEVAVPFISADEYPIEVRAGNLVLVKREIIALRAALSEARADTARIDWLESEARRDPLLLHNYHPGASVSRTSGSYRGLGMLDSRRTIREAIDAASAPSEPAT